MTVPTVTCPECGSTEGFEMRGNQRTYHRLDANLELDSWDGGEITFDTNDTGRDIVYCVSCDSEWDRDQLTDDPAVRPDVTVYGAGVGEPVSQRRESAYDRRERELGRWNG